MVKHALVFIQKCRFQIYFGCSELMGVLCAFLAVIRVAVHIYRCSEMQLC
jgi:hypothetical protein